MEWIEKISSNGMDADYWRPIYSAWCKMEGEENGGKKCVGVSRYLSSSSLPFPFLVNNSSSFCYNFPSISFINEGDAERDAEKRRQKLSLLSWSGQKKGINADADPIREGRVGVHYQDQ